MSSSNKAKPNLKNPATLQLSLFLYKPLKGIALKLKNSQFFKFFFRNEKLIKAQEPHHIRISFDQILKYTKETNLPTAILTSLSILKHAHNTKSLYLDLSHCSLNSESEYSISKAISEIQSLKKLCVNFNNNRAKCQFFSTFSTSCLSNLKTLRIIELDLSNNHIQAKGFSRIFEALIEMIDLVSLGLSISQSYFTTKEAKELAHVIGSLTNLKHISLIFEKNLLGDEGSKALSEQLVKKTNLKSLSLSLHTNLITDMGISDLSLSISNLTSLKCLSLDINNNYTSKGLTLLMVRIGALSKLEDLRLVLRCTEISESQVMSISRAFEGLSNLKNLYLNISRVGEKGAVYISQSLQNIKSLKALSLIFQNNGIKEEGAKALTDLRFKLSEITKFKVDLQYNSIGLAFKSNLKLVEGISI